ncbi:CsgG/HfaB family protein [Aureimonas sp. SK2]|uniref:CsgG/HfaB family protein n=1 Tax=Aureimonas sp. SK2 TaxID=3015992 RepID=UPI002443FDF1|nr:CsgG/HfaB family protein [Aureimonas sp. SK2]
MRASRLVAALVATSLLAGCAGAPGLASVKSNAVLVDGPPISDIVTPFDKALSCLKGKIAPNLVFAVGAVSDQTGKESFTDGGVGKFITQGAGDMVQSALFKAGTTVVNRRDPRITTVEVEWRIRDQRRIVPANFYITGSINSLDFIPGSGAEVEVAGVGGRYRQNRILVGLDVSLTEAGSGRIVANVPLNKQIFSSEAGIGVGRFVGDKLVSADIGGREREAIHFALRQMVYLATFELLTQVMKPGTYAECRSYIDRAHGQIDHTKTAQAAAASLPGVAAPITVPSRPETRAAAAASMQAAADAASPGTPPADNPNPDSRGAFPASNGEDKSAIERAKAQAVLTN